MRSSCSKIEKCERAAELRGAQAVAQRTAADDKRVGQLQAAEVRNRQVRPRRCAASNLHQQAVSWLKLMQGHN